LQGEGAYLRIGTRQLSARVDERRPTFLFSRCLTNSLLLFSRIISLILSLDLSFHARLVFTVFHRSRPPYITLSVCPSLTTAIFPRGPTTIRHPPPSIFSFIFLYTSPSFSFFIFRTTPRLSLGVYRIPCTTGTRRRLTRNPYLSVSSLVHSNPSPLLSVVSALWRILSTYPLFNAFMELWLSSLRDLSL